MRALAIIMTAALTGTAGCGPQVDAQNAPASPSGVGDAMATVSHAAPEVASFKTILYSERDAEVTARMDGVVRAQHAELGDAVGQNAVLAVLEDEREQAALQSAQAAVDLARSERTRASKLRESEMITQADLDAAIYKEKAAEAALRDAQVELGYTRVRAPFAGRISQRLIRVGQTVRVGDPLFRVTAPQPLRAALRLPELEAIRLKRGQSVALRGEDGSTVNASVARISPTVDAASGTIEVLLDVARPGTLRPGSTVTLATAPSTSVKAAQ
jgi:RND family efflux transporter MFP subunit